MAQLIHAHNQWLYNAGTRQHHVLTVDAGGRPAPTLCGELGRNCGDDASRTDCPDCLELRSWSKRRLFARAREMKPRRRRRRARARN